jgi:hypothetical protein
MRHHPLDEWEDAMIDDVNYDGQGKSRAEETWDSVQMLAGVAVACLGVLGFVIWGLWP